MLSETSYLSGVPREEPMGRQGLRLLSAMAPCTQLPVLAGVGGWSWVGRLMAFLSPLGGGGVWMSSRGCLH